MPLASNRAGVTVSIQADDHLEKIIKARKRKGLRVNKTSYLSELILSQPINPQSTVPNAPVAEAQNTHQEETRVN